MGSLVAEVLASFWERWSMIGFWWTIDFGQFLFFGADVHPGIFGDTSSGCIFGLLGILVHEWISGDIGCGDHFWFMLVSAFWVASFF